MNKNFEIDKENEFSLLSEKPIDLMSTVIKYLSYWKWFVLSATLCLIFAGIYLSYTLPKYKVSTSILFKDEQRGSSSELSVFQEMGLISQNNNVDNEIEILKKSLIAEKVVKDLGIFISYTEIGNFKILETIGLNKVIPALGRHKTKVLYGNESPFLIKITEEDLKKLTEIAKMEVLVHPDGNLEFSGTYSGQKFNEKVSASADEVKLPFGNIIVQRGNNKLANSMLVEVNINSPFYVAKNYIGQLNVELVSTSSSVADVSIICLNENLGVDFLAALIETYNKETVDEQMKMANRTSKLIDEQLAALSTELDDVESLAENFKQSQGLADIETQSNIYSGQVANMEQRRMELETQYSIISDLNGRINQQSNHEQLFPTNSGIRSEALNEQLRSYNALILEKNRLSRIASSSNQAMIDLNNRIESMYSSVRTGLQNEMKYLQIERNDLTAQYSQNRGRIRAIPRQERVYADIQRQQNVKEGVFIYLLQRKEEKYMSMATIGPNSRIVDNISSLGAISPNPKMLFLISLFFGLLIPVVGIRVKELLRYQISDKKELEAITSVPVLAEIPKNKQLDNSFINENNTDGFSELLRLLRANLMFVIDSKEKKVINMLSSISGEGKTFLSINLATSLALLDKKVLLVELDIRKPRLAEYIEVDNKNGITLYLSGHLDKKELIKPSGLHHNLSVITAGAIPPNPNELIAKPILDELIQDFRDSYDYIIIDTPPVGVVSDSFLLNRLADVNLFVVRADYTPKKYIEEANNYYKQEKLTNMYFILNSVDFDKNAFRYGYGKKYGYGYGYEIKQAYTI